MSFENSGWKSNNNNSQGGGNNNWKQRDNKPQGEWKPDDTPPEPLKPYIPFAIIGDPETPEGAIREFERLTKELIADGFTVRTGCDNPTAKAVTAVAGQAEVFVPWGGFGGQEAFYGKTNNMSQRIACHFAPYLITAKRAARVIQSYYLLLLLGKDNVSHSRFLITWTPKGEETMEGVNRETGSMGLIIKVANSLNIPVFNLGNNDAVDRCKRFLSGFKGTANTDARNVVTKPPSKYYNADKSEEDDFNY